MGTPPETPNSHSQDSLREVIIVLGRIANSLESLERLYAAEVQVYQKQRQEAEDERKRWQERQKQRDEDEKRLAEETKKAAELQTQMADVTKNFLASARPEKWQMQVLWVMIAVILAGFLKASVLYLFGYWPTPS